MPKLPQQYFDFTGVTLSTDPFPHFALPNFADSDLGDTLLGWFEGAAQWATHNQDGFYESYDLSLRESVLPPELLPLVAPDLTGYLKAEVARIFSATLSDRVDVTAHKLIPPYRIGIHTDYGETKQTHRLLIQINQGWKAERGGLLMFLSSKSPSELTDRDRLFIPHHRCAMCFEVSPRSFHAVSPVKDGNRYTLCFSFYGIVASTVALT